MKNASATNSHFAIWAYSGKFQSRWCTKKPNLKCGYRLDLVVEKEVVLELKSIEAFSPVHEAVMLTYLRLSGYRIGLLINFNVTILKDGIRRFVFEPGDQEKNLHRGH